MIEFGVLGPLSIRRDGSPVVVGTRSLGRLLAVLVCRANRAVTVAELADAIWDGDPSANPRKAIHVYVHRLRLLLGDGDLVIGDQGYYSLAVGAHQVDALRFASLVARGRAAHARQDLDAARSLFRQALGLWRGRPYDSVAYGTLIADEVRRLDEQHLLVQEALFAVELDLGNDAEMVGELARLAAANPYHERLSAMLMRALHRAGRRSEALEVFRSTRAVLVDELGVEPGEDLQKVHQAILRGEMSAPRPAAGDVESTPNPVPRQLPGGVVGFSGRNQQMKALDQLLPDSSQPDGLRISVIAGTAGVGKTTLAVHWGHQVADQFPDGQLYVDLRGFDPSRSPMDPAEAVRGFLAAFEYPPQRIPVEVAAQAGLYRSLLADKRVLVVLDNARDGDQVRPLLPGSPGCLVLVTSRERMPGVVAATGAYPLMLDVLPENEAQALLARRLGPDRLAAEPDAADEIIQRCARLPLALAIAASHAASYADLSLSGLADQLRTASGLDAFDAGDAATDARAVFSWSYEALSPEAARLFRLLGVHPGPDLSMPAAASLAGVEPQRAQAMLAELTRAHLVNERVPGRYSCHDLLRSYAGELAHRHDTETARRTALHQLLEHYMHSARAAVLCLDPNRDPMPETPVQPEVTPETFDDVPQAMGWFTATHAALLAAIEHAAGNGFDAHAHRLAWTLVPFLDRRGHWHDWLDVQRIAVDATARMGDRSEQARAHRGLASAYKQLGLYDEANVHFGYALDLYREHGDQLGEALTHNSLSLVLERQDRLREAIDHNKLALDLFRAVGDRSGQGRCLHSIGWYHARLGEHEIALTHCQQALPLLAEVGDRAEPYTWGALGYLHHQLGDYDSAIAHHRQALTRFQEQGYRYPEAQALDYLGDTYLAANDLDAARTVWRQALSILGELRHPDADKVRAKLHDL
ncbi:SARP family transcriptional regulator [Rhizocola hellebori]|uniref:SARP family transcriptional regulator n=1 Tax=Rhizocola hellebori TaxID=1392758 RepID=A0A8J3Q516_9ACTN|nr:BTAD domain-containing putative transcriptional regulator [Rhizocola hellebori]GIH03559.1 SARP family transcriptional regulator [Rhizocola hellebori]